MVRYTHFGEGAYADTENRIRELLEETGADLTDDDLDFPSDQLLDPGLIYFQGAWRIGLEDACHGRTTTGYEDSLSLVFSARTVNAVLTSELGEPYRVLVTLNGRTSRRPTGGQT